MELIYDFMKEDLLRHRLNALTQKIFGFDFEKCVVDGYFEGDYIPYSLMEGDKIIANVSVNKMHFIQNGVTKNYIQLGTVMTDAEYRQQGYARKLMKHILKEYEDKCDGFYLFGNLSALVFYRKTGFREGIQYQYTLKKEYVNALKNGAAFKKIDKQKETQYMETVRNSAVNSALEQINKFGLQMFYTANLKDVYYAEDIDCFIVLKQCGRLLTIQSVISKERILLQDIISRINVAYDCLNLGFTPCAEDRELFEAAAYSGGDDYRLLYLGEELMSIEREKLFFPQMSHA